jgi:signal transduction histidine kinase
VSPRNWSIRLRLTALYGGLVLVTGAVLLSVLYVLLDRSIARQPVDVPIVYASRPAADGSPGPTVEQAAALLKQRLNEAEQDLRDGVRRQTVPPLMDRGLLTLGALVVGGLWIGWFASGRALRPIQQITDTARRVADRNLHERIGLAGPRHELRELAETFDGMLGRLDAAFNGQRQFVGNASHELKTPLAINRTLLEVAMSRPDATPQLRHLGEVLLEVNARQERLLDGLLTLARSEHDIADPVPVDLAEVARAVVAVAQPEADRLGVAVRLEVAAAPVQGDPLLLERLVQNLVQNAIRHNAPKGWMQLSTDRVGTDMRLTVSNTGPVVPPASIPGLFEPFRRATDRVGSARGTGLGLSIVRSVARAHNGKVTAAARDGGGLVVEVTLPSNDR